MFVFFCQLHIYFWPQSTQMYPATLLTRKSRNWWQGPCVFEIQDATGLLWQNMVCFSIILGKDMGHYLINIDLAASRNTLWNPIYWAPERSPKVFELKSTMCDERIEDFEQRRLLRIFATVVLYASTVPLGILSPCQQDPLESYLKACSGQKAAKWATKQIGTLHACWVGYFLARHDLDMYSLLPCT